jgi:choice-of-anchor B domain-containing protein
MRWMALVFLAVLCLAGPVVGQHSCNCAGPCDSGCMCGCNSPENSPAAGGQNSYGGSRNIKLYAHLPLSSMGVTTAGVLANDCWGWNLPGTSREFAIVGLTNGTAFVEITNPENPVYLGTLPGAGGNEAWRDMKVLKNWLYVVADGSSNSSHGVQVFDLTRLTQISNPPAVLQADARFTGLGRAHNIAINEQTGFAYVVGSPSLSSAGGLIMLDLKKGKMPVLSGVYAGDGYTHDTQVVLYDGPDESRNGTAQTYVGREIAFSSNEDTLTIVDVTNKAAPILISRTPYAGSRYSHQGWLTPDHRYFLMDDELDELQAGPFPTRTRVWDLKNLDAPVYLGHHSGTEKTIDHNQYIKDDYTYQANYTSGLRILKIVNPATATLREDGFLDTYGQDDDMTFNGAWSCYPYFPSELIIVTDRQNGLFVLRFSPPPN